MTPCSVGLCWKVQQENAWRYAWAKQEQIRANQGSKADEIEFLKSFFSLSHNRDALSLAVQELRREQAHHGFEEAIRYSP